MYNLLTTEVLYELKWILSNHYYIINVLLLFIFLFYIYQFFGLKYLATHRKILIPDFKFMLKNYWKPLIFHSIVIFGLSYLTNIRSIYLVAFAWPLIILWQIPNWFRIKFYAIAYLAIYSLVFAREFYCVFYVALIDIFITALMKSNGMQINRFSKKQIKRIKEIYNNIWELVYLIILSVKSMEMMRLLFQRIALWPNKLSNLRQKLQLKLKKKAQKRKAEKAKKLKSKKKLLKKKIKQNPGEAEKRKVIVNYHA